MASFSTNACGLTEMDVSRCSVFLEMTVDTGSGLEGYRGYFPYKVNSTYSLNYGTIDLFML